MSERLTTPCSGGNNAAAGAMQSALAALKQIRYLATAEGHASHRRAAKNRDGREVKTVADALHYQLGADRVAIDEAIRLLEDQGRAALAKAKGNQ